MTPLEALGLLLGMSPAKPSVRSELSSAIERLVEHLRAGAPLQISYAETRALLRVIEQLHRLGSQAYAILLRPALERLPQPDDAQSRLVSALRHALFAYPLATQRIVAALIAEGRRYAETEEGAALRDRLTSSAWVDEAASILEIALPGDLEHGWDRLPYAYLDLLFASATSRPQ